MRDQATTNIQITCNNSVSIEKAYLRIIKSKFPAQPIILRFYHSKIAASRNRIHSYLIRIYITTIPLPLSHCTAIPSESNYPKKLLPTTINFPTILQLSSKTETFSYINRTHIHTRHNTLAPARTVTAPAAVLLNALRMGPASERAVAQVRLPCSAYIHIIAPELIVRSRRRRRGIRKHIHNRAA